MGVASIKIEGRMKRPEYVAIVTRAYRTVLNGGKLTQADLQELETAFSRQGFTDGYFKGQTGSDMFGRRQRARTQPTCSPLPAPPMSRARRSASACAFTP